MRPFSFQTLKSYAYPKSDSFTEILFSSVGAGITVYLFLIIFQPFGTENFHHPYKYLLLFPYTLIFGIVFFISSLYTFRFNNWNILSELLKIFLVLLLGSVLSYFYNSLFISHVKLSFENYIYMFLYSMAIGIPVSIIYILSRYIYLKRTHENTAKDISQHLSYKTEYIPNKTLTISANNLKLTLAEHDFLCAQSMENYCALYFSENGLVKKKFIRISLSELLKQTETNTIQKCHRSYIVNLDKVESLRGNAQGYKLILPKIDFEIPVSRSFIPQIIPQLQQ